MTFLEPEINTFLEHLKNLRSDQQPEWGTMSAQRMVEHLSDSIDISLGHKQFALSIPEDKIERAQGFLRSEHPMPKNFKVEFASDTTPVRNDDLTDAIDEFRSKWAEFKTLYDSDKGKRTLHPNFGELDRDLWLRCHSKHFTHHFEQFGLL